MNDPTRLPRALACMHLALALLHGAADHQLGIAAASHVTYLFTIVYAVPALALVLLQRDVRGATGWLCAALVGSFVYFAYALTDGASVHSPLTLASERFDHVAQLVRAPDAPLVPDAAQLGVWKPVFQYSAATLVLVDLMGALWLVLRLARHTALRQGARHVVLVDGECVACHRIVSTILRLDRRGLFQFAHLQGDFGRRVVRQHGHDPHDVDPIYLLANAGTEHEVLLVDGEAGREIWPSLFRAAAIVRLIPLVLLDLQYRAFARLRYRLAGKYDQCHVPSEEERARFVG